VKRSGKKNQLIPVLLEAGEEPGKTKRRKRVSVLRFELRLVTKKGAGRRIPGVDFTVVGE